MFDISSDVMIFMIPIIAILGGCTVSIVGIIMKGREEELRRRERILAIEKGLPIPPEPSSNECSRPGYVAARGWGLVLTFMGAALVISISLASDEGVRHGTWGIIVLAIGLGLLVASALEKREYDSKNKQ